jgi:hypothetical protein
MHACEKLFPDLVKTVNTANTIITDNITNLDDTEGKKKLVCVRANTEQNFYTKYVTEEWTKIVQELSLQSPCHRNLFSLMNEEQKTNNIEEQTMEYLVKVANTSTFVATADPVETIKGILFEYAKNCGCKLYGLFKRILMNHTGEYRKLYVGMNKEAAKIKFKEDYDNFKVYVYDLFKNLERAEIETNSLTMKPMITKFKDEAMKFNPNKLLNTFSISNEIDNLIPDSLGAMKEFFKTLIVTYYNKIHPVIWCQIFAKICSNFFVYMPKTKDQFYQFISSQLLLNSGPVILKLLQMMRPLLSPEIQQKYNLTKLTYPLLTNEQVTLILNKILNDPANYQILNNLSASVGHVVVLRKVDVKNPFIIKIIKPLSIVQSCAEYTMLKDTFQKNTCEQNFIDNMIYAIGIELDANNEKNNIKLGHKYYTDNYSKIFGYNTGHVITTLQVIDGVIKKDCWYALAVTMASGMPISKLVENNMIKGDTKFRASLHRGLDLLVYKFFYVLFSKGFYHGDLHAGNIFFSFQQKTLTLIDFGAVGKLNIFSDDPSVDILTEVIIMSIFFNYDGIMNKLTEFLNRQCIKTGYDASIIDMASPAYISMHETIKNYSKIAIGAVDKSKIIYDNNIKKIFNEERINEEAYDIVNIKDATKRDNIYSYLDILPTSTEVVEENNEELRNLGLESLNANNKSLNEILILLFSFYAENNVNIAIKFSEIYEFQKAYTLLLGVLQQTQYDSYRMNYVINQAIVNRGHISKLFHVSKVSKIIKIYSREQSIYKKRLAGDFN